MLSFLNFLFKDPTAEWKECFRVPLSLSLYSNSVNNIAVGDSFERLQTFGRPNNRQPFKENRFIYFQLGLDIRGKDGKISSFYFTVRQSEELFEIDRNEAKYVPTEFSLINKNGGHLAVNKDTSPESVERFLGVPTEKDTDVDFLSLIYLYENDSIELDFTFGENNLLQDVYFGA